MIFQGFGRPKGGIGILICIPLGVVQVVYARRKQRHIIHDTQYLYDTHSSLPFLVQTSFCFRLAGNRFQGITMISRDKKPRRLSNYYGSSTVVTQIRMPQVARGTAPETTTGKFSFFMNSAFFQLPEIPRFSYVLFHQLIIIIIIIN